MGRDRRSSENHRKALDTIANTPSSINLFNINNVEIETPFMRGGRLFTEIDLILTGKNTYVVEYKLTDGYKARHKAIKQLKKARWCLQNYREIQDLNLLYVHSNFIVQRFIDGCFFSFP